MVMGLYVLLVLKFKWLLSRMGQQWGHWWASWWKRTWEWIIVRMGFWRWSGLVLFWLMGPWGLRIMVWFAKGYATSFQLSLFSESLHPNILHLRAHLFSWVNHVYFLFKWLFNSISHFSCYKVFYRQQIKGISGSLIEFVQNVDFSLKWSKWYLYFSLIGVNK